MEDYRTVLNEVLQFIKSEETIAEQIRIVKAEPVLEVRIQLLAQMLASLQARPERAELERQLLLDKKTLKTLQDEQQAKILQSKRVLEGLRALKTSQNLKAAVVTLQEFLAANPDSPDRIEVKSILNECVAKMTLQREHKKWGYFVGALLIVLFGISCIHINYFKYTLLSPYTTATPRTPSYKTDTLTDPLSLTAKASKARNKTKTAKIQPPQG